MQLISEIDRLSPERLGSVIPASPRLALEIVDDGMVRSLPRWRTKLLAHSLQEHTPRDLLSIARILLRYADLSDDQAAEVAADIQKALDGESVASRATVLALQEHVPDIADEMQLGLRAKTLARVLRTPNSKLDVSQREPDWAAFQEEVLTAPVDPAVETVARGAAEALYSLLTRDQDNRAMERLPVGLRSVESAEVLKPHFDT
ncbi:hypothetical protein [Microbacterium sp. 179-I 3D4 NHS]|uniref:hypothetical protein n=1 Tax=Microbacterium sp. 179-I 3D4 NHS TaxID=3142381 RepID=UPI0039A39F7B